MTAPSNANTSGLEVAAWRFKFAASNSWAYQPGPPAPEWEDDCRDVQSLVTAASAQAAIDAEKARADRLAKALGPFIEDWAHLAEVELYETCENQAEVNRIIDARAALQQETQK